MTVDDHGVMIGEDGGAIAEELMASGVERSGLDRRHLIGGLAAGAAGLLLPKQGASAKRDGLITLKEIRMVLINRDWGSWQLGNCLKLSDVYSDDLGLLCEGQQTTIQSSPTGYIPTLFRWASRSGRWDDRVGVRARNPTIGKPTIEFSTQTYPNSGEFEMALGRSRVYQVPGTNLDVKVTRNDDTDKFKVFTVEYRGGKRGGPNRRGAKPDKNANHKRSKHNDYRRRKRGGGGLSDTNRRERPRIGCWTNPEGLTTRHWF